MFVFSDNTSATQINKVRCHPTLPVAVTAHEDKYLRFYDITSGAVTHSMVAHGDAVSGIAIDPNGLYLLSSSMLLYHYQCLVHSIFKPGTSVCLVYVCGVSI